jgi:hypothetical protein
METQENVLERSLETEIIAATKNTFFCTLEWQDRLLWGWLLMRHGDTETGPRIVAESLQAMIGHSWDQLLKRTSIREFRIIARSMLWWIDHLGGFAELPNDVYHHLLSNDPFHVVVICEVRKLVFQGKIRSKALASGILLLRDDLTGVSGLVKLLQHKRLDQESYTICLDALRHVGGPCVMKKIVSLLGPEQSSPTKEVVLDTLMRANIMWFREYPDVARHALSMFQWLTYREAEKFERLIWRCMPEVTPIVQEAFQHRSKKVRFAAHHILKDVGFKITKPEV